MKYCDFRTVTDNLNGHSLFSFRHKNYSLKFRKGHAFGLHTYALSTTYPTITTNPHMDLSCCIRHFTRGALQVVMLERSCSVRPTSMGPLIRLGVRMSCHTSTGMCKWRADNRYILLWQHQQMHLCSKCLMWVKYVQTKGWKTKHQTIKWTQGVRCIMMLLQWVILFRKDSSQSSGRLYVIVFAVNVLRELFTCGWKICASRAD